MRTRGKGIDVSNASITLANAIANRDDVNDDLLATFSARSERQELPGAMTPSSIRTPHVGSPTEDHTSYPRTALLVRTLPVRKPSHHLNVQDVKFVSPRLIVG
jgi:hypothetical protein